VDAALRLIARKEVGEIALLEVAAEAEVSNGTIYNYFRTRDEVLEAVGITLADEFSDAISVLSANFDQAIRSRLATHVLSDLREGLREGAFTFEDEGIAMDIVVSCTTGAMRSVVEGRAVTGHDVQVAEMVLKALGATPARARKIASLALPTIG
jgi:AcrR family transcriptional regulator